MRWLKPLISAGLLLAAAGIALSTGLSDHSGDYGRVPLPPGGTVHLPEGKAVVYFDQPGDDQSNPVQQVTTPLSFQVVSRTGTPVPASEGGSATVSAVERSETVGELGSIAKLDVPASGDYLVSGTAAVAPGTAFLKFGTNAGAALAHKWKLFAGLIIGAILIALIPTPKPRKRWEDEAGPPTGWSSDSRAPYAG
jgi:hypothetical protein